MLRWIRKADSVQAARARARVRARGCRNTTTFAIMIYLLAAPLGDLFQST